MAANGRRVVGVDLGGSKLLTGVIDESLEVYSRVNRAVIGLDQGELIDAMVDAIDEVRQKVPDGLLARATPARLREAIGVLLDNAMRHGKGTVTLAARDGGGTVIVEVGDAGPGVPDQLVPHVFERGFSAAGSTGVGLALARALVEADGGRLELSKARPALFEIYLPVARADDVLGIPWKIESTPR